MSGLAWWVPPASCAASSPFSTSFSGRSGATDSSSPRRKPSTRFARPASLASSTPSPCAMRSPRSWCSALAIAAASTRWSPRSSPSTPPPCAVAHSGTASPIRGSRPRSWRPLARCCPRWAIGAPTAPRRWRASSAAGRTSIACSCSPGSSRRIDADSGLQLGFQTHRLLGQLGAARARQSLASLRTLLRDSLGTRSRRRARRRAREGARGRRGGRARPCPQDLRGPHRRGRAPARGAHARDDALRVAGGRRDRGGAQGGSPVSPSACAVGLACGHEEPSRGASIHIARSGAPCARAASRSRRPARGGGAIARSSFCSAT